jgi:hypothetical protein
MLLEPACQPVPPPGTVAVAHRSVPPPLPCSVGRATCHAAPPVRTAARPLQADAAPLRCPTLCPGPPLSSPFPPSMQRPPLDPLLCLAASASKSRPTLSCLPLLFYHSLSSVHGQATHLSSMPATEPPRPLPACF